MPQERLFKYQNFPTQFHLSLFLECFSQNLMKIGKSKYPIDLLKVDVFLPKSNARF